ncbi:hypothetical protein ABIE67_010207 [Streptomyces sp. V4I8]|uniref:hypothetical protein n=1 Tax=Streptomyces sp. V4I8 TaxID=3156469 RepID=UPI0035135F6B
MRAVVAPRRRAFYLLTLAFTLVVISAVTLLLVRPQSRSDCGALSVESWAADNRVTTAFARYGDDGGRMDDWTGGDGTHSVRLPDGRTLWLFSDPFLGLVHGPPNTAGQPHSWRDTSVPGGAAWVRNAAVVMSASGRLERTLTGGTAGAPAPLFPDLSQQPKHWRWPVAAVVEPRTPSASEKVVRVLLWNRMVGPAPFIYGVPTGTEVATLSLPELKVERIDRISDQGGVEDLSRRVLHGTTAVHDGGWTYVFGGDDGRAGTPVRPSSHAYVARVPVGLLSEASAWRYWNGTEWQREPPVGQDRDAHVLGNGGRRGVGSAFTVIRQDDTWVLFTMDAGSVHGSGLSTITTYWACSPQGPWHGPHRGFDAPLPADSVPNGAVAAYNPQAHPEFTEDGTTADALLLSYDVNWLSDQASTAEANVNRNVALYRPRFVRVKLEPPSSPEP